MSDHQERAALPFSQILPSFPTFMEPLSAEASYWVVLFISPRITVSREPDSAPFRAEIMS